MKNVIFIVSIFNRIYDDGKCRKVEWGTPNETA
jgi:hypothetical protein